MLSKIKETKKMWTRNYTLFMLSSFISGIGGEALTLPLSLAVFAQTKSPILSTIIIISEFLPDMLFGVILGPLVDKYNKKKIVQSTTVLFIIAFMIAGVYTNIHGLQYMFILIFSFIISTLSVVVHLAIWSWVPDLIEPGYEQQSYSWMGIVYPIAKIIMAPVSVLLSKTIGLGNLFYIMVVSLIINFVVVFFIKDKKSKKSIHESENKDTLLDVDESEHKLDEKEDNKKKASYFTEIIKGFEYLKNEKGLYYITAFICISSALSSSFQTIYQYVFQTTPHLGEMLYATLMSVCMIARTFTGFFNGIVTIPTKWRYYFVVSIYMLYNILPALASFSVYAVILLTFILVSAGSQVSATLRFTAFFNYIREDVRGRVNSIVSFAGSVGLLVSYLVTGFLAEILPFRILLIIIALLDILCAYVFVVRNKRHVKPLYEYEKPNEKE